MEVTPKRYKKIRKLLNFRIRVALWLMRKGYGNKDLLKKYSHKQLDNLHLIIRRELTELGID